MQCSILLLWVDSTCYLKSCGSCPALYHSQLHEISVLDNYTESTLGLQCAPDYHRITTRVRHHLKSVEVICINPGSRSTGRCLLYGCLASKVWLENRGIYAKLSGSDIYMAIGLLATYKLTILPIAASRHKNKK